MATLQKTKKFYEEVIKFDKAAGGDNLFHHAHFSRQDPSVGNCRLHALQKDAFDDNYLCTIAKAQWHSIPCNNNQPGLDKFQSPISTGGKDTPLKPYLRY
jgi:hypothetical protein